MEKSIEEIWKEGFLDQKALIAPKVNNLYTQKSIHVIDKFRRMFRWNLIGIALFAIAFLIASFPMKVELIGMGSFVIMMSLLILNLYLLQSLKNIDKGSSSYDYLKSFSTWMRNQSHYNERFALFMYPACFLSIIFGMWFKDAEGEFLGIRLVQKIVAEFPDTYLVFGVPLIGVVGVVLVTVLLMVFSKKIYRTDQSLVYRGVINKMNELLAEMEELQKDPGQN